MIHMPASARVLAESLMTDTVTWTRAAAVVTPVVVDPVTGLVNSNPDVVVYVGPARRRSKVLPRTASGTVSAGDFVVDTVTFVSIPVSAPSLRVDDFGVVTVSDVPGDVGRRYRVTNLVMNTQRSAQRVQVQSVVG